MTDPAANPAPSITIMVETSSGVFRRHIHRASPLPEGVEHGGAAEDATRLAAAYWGLPDFVFRPTQHRRGSGSRELGDALIVVGDRAASVQVKARAEASNDDHRERSWLDKKIKKATDQAGGTVRALQAADMVTLVNERGREIVIDAQHKAWVNVVVIDHPGVDGYVPRGSAVVLLRRDWEFLFQQLKSTYAVVEYLHRVKGSDPIELGTEPVRYYEFAAADAAAPPSAPDPRLEALGFDRPTSLPLLPQAPAGHRDDGAHAIVRIILEDLAVTGIADEVDRLDTLAAIDAVPVAYRAELGRDVIRWIDDVAGVPEPELTWRFRNLPWAGRPYLIFGAASWMNERIQEQFGDFITLRHQQRIELMPERADAMTVGVLLTPRRDGVRLWDTTIAATRGQQGFDPRFRAFLEDLWGPFGASKRHDDADWDRLETQVAELRRGDDPVGEFLEADDPE